MKKIQELLLHVFWFLGHLKAQSLVLSSEDEYSVLGEQFTFTCRIKGSGNVDSIQFRKDDYGVCVVILESCQPSRPPKYSCGCSPNNVYEAQITIMEVSLQDAATWSCQDFTNSAVLSNLIVLQVHSSNTTQQTTKIFQITTEDSTTTIQSHTPVTHQTKPTTPSILSSLMTSAMPVMTTSSGLATEESPTPSSNPSSSLSQGLSSEISVMTTSAGLTTRESPTPSSTPSPSLPQGLSSEAPIMTTSAGLTTRESPTPSSTPSPSLPQGLSSEAPIMTTSAGLTTRESPTPSSTRSSSLPQGLSSEVPIMTTSAGLTARESQTPSSTPPSSLPQGLSSELSFMTTSGEFITSSNQMSQQGLSTGYIIAIIVLAVIIIVIITVVIGVVFWKRRKKEAGNNNVADPHNLQLENNRAYEPLRNRQNHANGQHVELTGFREGDYMSLSTPRDTHTNQLPPNSPETHPTQPNTLNVYTEIDDSDLETSRNSDTGSYLQPQLPTIELDDTTGRNDVTLIRIQEEGNQREIPDKSNDKERTYDKLRK